jgi:hypothetical protein
MGAGHVSTGLGVDGDCPRQNSRAPSFLRPHPPTPPTDNLRVTCQPCGYIRLDAMPTNSWELEPAVSCPNATVRCDCADLLIDGLKFPNVRYEPPRGHYVDVEDIRGQDRHPPQSYNRKFGNRTCYRCGKDASQHSDPARTLCVCNICNNEAGHGHPDSVSRQDHEIDRLLMCNNTGMPVHLRNNRVLAECCALHEG